MCQMSICKFPDMAGNENGSVFSHPCFRAGDPVERSIVLGNKLITNS